MTGVGARIILKSRYNNPSKNASGGTGKYAQYVSERDGVVKETISLADDNATEAQQKFIAEITDDIPEAKHIQEYFSYQKQPTVQKAHEFISQALDKFGDEVVGMDGYVSYIANRPGSVKVKDNGLFSDGDDEIDLTSLQEELRNYNGNVYMPIISLRPEDSHGFGYDNPDAWHKLIENHRDEIAKQYSISPENFRWVGAYHNAFNSDGYEHNHVHLLVWSNNPNEGWQSQETGNNIRKILAKDIFKEELKQNNEFMTKTRDEIRQQGYDKATQLAQEIVSNPLRPSTTLQAEFKRLGDSLQSFKGRKYYAYLPQEQKQMVNNILQDMVEEDPRMMEMLEAWADTKDKQLKIYSNKDYVLPPISEIRELNAIKNRIVGEASKMSRDIAKNNRTMKRAEQQAEKQQRQQARQLVAVEKTTESFMKQMEKILRQEGRRLGRAKDFKYDIDSKDDAEQRWRLGMK